MSNLKTTKSKEKVLKITTENLRSLVEEMIQYLPEIEMNKDKFLLVVEAKPEGDRFCARIRQGIRNSSLGHESVIIKDDAFVGTFSDRPRHGLEAPMYYTSDKRDKYEDMVRIWETYANTLNVHVSIVSYVFILLHELGHITTKLDIPGYDADMGEVLTRVTGLLYAYQRRIEVPREETRKVYRYKYAELFADHYAWKYLLVILTKIDCSKYFELITEAQFNKEKEKHEEDEKNGTDS